MTGQYFLKEMVNMLLMTKIPQCHTIKYGSGSVNKQARKSEDIIFKKIPINQQHGLNIMKFSTLCIE